MMRLQKREISSGFTLLEVIFALVLATAVAVIGIRHLNTPGVSARQRTCDMTRQTLQGHAERFRDDTGAWPSRDLRELAASAYAGATVPPCPVSGDDYEIRRGVVACPTHEATR